MSEADDPVELAVWGYRLAQVAEEMGETLRRSALSPNIKERRDFSCAICDGDGRLVAQAAHIPVHLGSTGLSVRAAIGALELGPGAIAILNDPFHGGTHLPDVTLVEAVEIEGVRFLLANRAHHADIGGTAPGSMAGPRAPAGDPAGAPQDEISMGPRGGATVTATQTIDDEGVRLPPTLLDEQVASAFAARSRAPGERRGDLAAQQAALTVGRRRLVALAERHGAQAIARWGAALRTRTARSLRAAIAAIPDGRYAFADSLDDDGAGAREIAVRVLLTVDGDHVTVDFRDSDPETPGSLNAVRAVTVSCVAYAFRLLCVHGTPTNDGIFDPIEILTEPGTIVDARPPRAVAAGNVETSQRIVDVLLGVLAQALPDRVPSASCGTMSNLMLGGGPSGGPGWAYYETIAGGAGAGPRHAGASAIQTHMTNTWNTPIEALELALPIRVARYALRRGSGGAGARNGGCGVERVIELLAPATVTLIGERRRRPPYGLAGGGPGATGGDALERAGQTIRLPAKTTFEGRTGDVLTVRTPGGGGHGRPG